MNEQRYIQHDSNKICSISQCNLKYNLNVNFKRNVILGEKEKLRALTSANSKTEEDSLNIQTLGKEAHKYPYCVNRILMYFYCAPLWKWTLSNFSKETFTDQASFPLANLSLTTDILVKVDNPSSSVRCSPLEVFLEILFWGQLPPP